jgi:hypothetical protein
MFPYIIPAGDVRKDGFTVPGSDSGKGDSALQVPYQLDTGSPSEEAKFTAVTSKRKKRRFIPFGKCCNKEDCNDQRFEENRQRSVNGITPAGGAILAQDVGDEWGQKETAAWRAKANQPKALPKPSTGKVMPLVAKEPSGIKAVSAEEWVQIDVQVDSGATETVMSEATLAGVIDITEGPAYKRGVVYEVANGEEIPNLGERKFLGYTDDGSVKAVTAQICAVNQTLMSVSKIASHGNRVVFDDDGSYIEDKASGEKTWMTQVGGMYSIKMWVSRKSTAEAGF